MAERQLIIDLPPTEGELALTESHKPMTSCANCGKRVRQSDAVYTATEDYCSERCANLDTLARIRREGI